LYAFPYEPHVISLDEMFKFILLRSDWSGTILSRAEKKQTWN